MKIIISILMLVLFVVFTSLSFSQVVPGIINPLANEQQQPSAGETVEQEAKPAVLNVSQSNQDPNNFSIELKDVQLSDLFRVLAYDHKLNILVDERVSGTITASLTNISLNDALTKIADLKNLTMEEKGGILVVKPNLVTETFILQYLRADDIAGAIGGASTEASAADGGGRTVSTIIDLLSEEGKILIGSQHNSLVVIDYPPNVEVIKSYISAIDRKMSAKAFKLKYISVKDLFPSLVTSEIERRQQYRDERAAERSEISDIGTSASGGSE